jgi:hypothetical protein
MAQPSPAVLRHDERESLDPGLGGPDWPEWVSSTRKGKTEIELLALRHEVAFSGRRVERNRYSTGGTRSALTHYQLAQGV